MEVKEDGWIVCGYCEFGYRLFYPPISSEFYRQGVVRMPIPWMTNGGNNVSH